MLRLIASIACALTLFAGSSLLADETLTAAAPTRSQQLKECMERQKTADVIPSKAQLKRYCKDQLKKAKATGQMPDPPPVDSPKNP